MKLNNTPELETDRLILRKFTANDIKAIFDLYSDREANRFLPWFPIETMEEAEQIFKERYAHTYMQPRGYRYAVCVKGGGPVGYVHMCTDDSFDLGYGLRREFWHQGIGEEAARAVIAQVKSDGYPYITATHDVKNPRSGRLMRKLGMEYQYTYEEQWQPKDIPVVFRLYQLNFDSRNVRTYDKYWIISKVHYVEEGI